MNTQKEILEILQRSDPEVDWQGVDKRAVNSDKSSSYNVIYFKDDVNLRFEEWVCLKEDSPEEWIGKFIDKSATSYHCPLYYYFTPVWNFFLVSVDGGRALLPAPRSAQELVIDPLTYKVAQIIYAQRSTSRLEELDEYINKAGFIIK